MIVPTSTIYLIRASLMLILPALVMLPFIHHGPAARNLWRLFWTFGFLAYLAHLIFAIAFVFGDHLATARLYPSHYGLLKENVSIYAMIVESQTAVVAWSNFAVSVVWLVDVFLAWFARPRQKVALFHGFAWLWVTASFLVSTVVLYKNQTAYHLGVGLSIAIGSALLVRMVWHPFGRGDATAHLAPTRP